MSRATSQAAVTSVKDCLALLKLQIKDSQSLSDTSPEHTLSHDHRFLMYTMYVQITCIMFILPRPQHPDEKASEEKQDIDKL